jgi:hypothetical protein
VVGQLVTVSIEIWAEIEEPVASTDKRELAPDSISFLFLGCWGGCRDRVSLYSPGCPGAHFVDQAGLELRNPPASASQECWD